MRSWAIWRVVASSDQAPAANLSCHRERKTLRMFQTSTRRRQRSRKFSPDTTKPPTYPPPMYPSAIYPSPIHPPPIYPPSMYPSLIYPPPIIHHPCTHRLYIHHLYIHHPCNHRLYIHHLCTLHDLLNYCPFSPFPSLTPSNSSIPIHSANISASKLPQCQYQARAACLPISPSISLTMIPTPPFRPVPLRSPLNPRAYPGSPLNSFTLQCPSLQAFRRSE